MTANLWLTLGALSVEAVFSYPQFLYRKIGHPVTYIAAGLTFLEAKLNLASANAQQKRWRGVLALGALLMATALVSMAITRIMPVGLAGTLLTAVIASSLFAQRSLYSHVADVAAALERQDLAAGRITVAKIVGRDPDVLDASGVARAAIESLAENFADGIVAPVFWMAVGGLAGAALYKAINTADSMIGHKNERYRDFGWASARLDDWVNLPASRLTAALLLIVAPSGRRHAAFQALRRDAKKHRSPNAGWPESAMAGALDLQLAGPRIYAGEIVPDAFMGHGRRDATAADIRTGLRLYRRACILQFMLVLALVVIARV
ncbi:MAG: cobalamin biosynthesis protein CobD [Hyphomicrobiales bacterium]|nr:cobalamin biosynthesis protein CobD [Hyphomicrobiales bacterium]MDE2113918.1 cobalamin biosynthesis protein CobD [Hyphomicrobiales bacterium]